MLIKHVTVYGGFELIYLALQTVSNFLPTVFALLRDLPPELRELYKMFVLIFLLVSIGKIKAVLIKVKTFINDRL